MVYRLQESSACCGGVDGDWSTVGSMRVRVAQTAYPELVKGPGKSADSTPRSASQSASVVRRSFGEREEP